MQRVRYHLTEEKRCLVLWNVSHVGRNAKKSVRVADVFILLISSIVRFQQSA